MSIEPKVVSTLDRERNIVYIHNVGKSIGVGGPLPTIKDGERLVRWTSSLCPYCFRILPAVIVERESALYIRRICPEHSEIEEIYFSDSEMFRRFEKYEYEGRGAGYAYTIASAPCPLNCGLCTLHKSHTSLLNIVLTNRCDLSCWYCFFYAERMGVVYEPTKEQIAMMIHALKKQKNIVPAVQLTGGEPTLREDLVEIVRMLRDLSVRHIQLNTHGIKFAYLYTQSPSKAIEYAKELRQAGINTVYLSFDGVRPETNPKNHWEFPITMEVFRHSGMTSVVLVPTVIRGVNDHELGDIIKIAAHNIDIVRGVNFQPISLVGMMRKHERSKYRITIPDVIKKIEEQTQGEISRNDWYPVGTVVPLARFIEVLDRSKRAEFTTHPACGAATYVYVEKKNGDYHFIPITRFIDVDGLIEYVYRKYRELESKPRVLAKMLAIPTILNIVNRYILWDRVPDPIKSEFKSIVLDIFFKRSYEALGRLHYRLLFLGMMHFMDEWNYDVCRVMRCVIHYALPDGRIVPFCAFNILNDLYREPSHIRYGIPLEEYVKTYGHDRIYGVKYVRNRELIEKYVRSEAYRRVYEPVLSSSR